MMSKAGCLSKNAGRSLQNDFHRLAARTIKDVGSDWIVRLSNEQINGLNLALAAIQLRHRSIEAVNELQLIVAYIKIARDNSWLIQPSQSPPVTMSRQIAA